MRRQVLEMLLWTKEKGWYQKGNVVKLSYQILFSLSYLWQMQVKVSHWWSYINESCDWNFPFFISQTRYSKAPRSASLADCTTVNCESVCEVNGTENCCNCSLSPVPTNNNPNSLVTVSINCSWVWLIYQNKHKSKNVTVWQIWKVCSICRKNSVPIWQYIANIFKKWHHKTGGKKIVYLQMTS